MEGKKTKNYEIESVTLWKEQAEFRIKRRHVTTGDVHITIANRLNKEETTFISRFVAPYSDHWILQWNKYDMEN